MINNPDLWQGFGAPGPRNRTEIEEREEQNTGTALLIWHNGKSEGRIRFVDIDTDWGNAELTCYVTPDSQSQGLATETCQIMIKYGFDYLPITKITMRVFESNEASRGLVEKLGFDHEGTLRDHVLHDGGYIDLCVYGLLEDEWRSSNGALS